MKAYKLFRQRKDGSIGPLFINASQKINLGEWMEAEDVPTKGFAHRPGWHAGVMPQADHLSEKGRVWAECDIEDFYRFKRPKNQGGEWLIGKRLRVNSILSQDQVTEIRRTK